MLAVQPSDLNSPLVQSTFQLMLKLSSKSYSLLRLRVWNSGTSFSLSYRCLRILFHLYCSKTLNPCWGSYKTVPADEMKACRINGGTAPHILDHNTGMAVRGRLQSPAAYLREGTSVSTENIAEWPAKPVWFIWRRDTSLAAAGIRTLCRRTRTPVTVSTELSRLLFFSGLTNISWVLGGMSRA